MYTINDRLVFRRVVKSKDFQSALSNINCSFQNIMFCIIRSHSLSIWPISLWSDVVKSVGSRNNEQKWCPLTEHHSAFPISWWTEVLFSCCPFPPLLSLALPRAARSPELGQWWLLPPMAGWQREQSALSCNYPLPIHSSSSSVIQLMPGFLQLEEMGLCESRRGRARRDSFNFWFSKYVRPSNLRLLPAASSTEGQYKRIP